MTTRFLASELPETPADACLFQVIPTPYEATVSYGRGTALGPQAILEASLQLEVWTGYNNPSQHGIFTWPAVDCEGAAPAVLHRIEQAAANALEAGQGQGIPVLLGGEHSITLGALRAIKKRYGPFGIIQLDAHADLRDSYEGTPYSHACVMRRAVDDLELPLFQVGVRSLSPEEASFREQAGIGHLDARDLAEKGGLAWINASGGSADTLLPPGFPERLFVTFDVDALDAGLMPATGTPEPGGLGWWDALFLLRNILTGRQVLGCDVTELAPVPSLHAPTYSAARLAYELMGLIAQGRKAE